MLPAHPLLAVIGEFSKYGEGTLEHWFWYYSELSSYFLFEQVMKNPIRCHQKEMPEPAPRFPADGSNRITCDSGGARFLCYRVVAEKVRRRERTSHSL
jgi:hypothetical protein